MAESPPGVSAFRPLLERTLLNEYRFDWIAFPATKGYLRMYPPRLLQNLPGRKMDYKNCQARLGDS